MCVCVCVCVCVCFLICCCTHARKLGTHSGNHKKSLSKCPFLFYLLIFFFSSFGIFPLRWFGHEFLNAATVKNLINSHTLKRHKEKNKKTKTKTTTPPQKKTQILRPVFYFFSFFFFSYSLCLFFSLSLCGLVLRL